MAARKRCFKCHKRKAVSEFNASKNKGLHSYCRPCQRSYDRVRFATASDEERKRRVGVSRCRRAEIRRKVCEAKNVPCTDCGGRYPSFVMDFDHRDPSQKLGDISSLVPKESWVRVQAEIAKCDVVCANCHRIRTHKHRLSV